MKRNHTQRLLLSACLLLVTASAQGQFQMGQQYAPGAQQSNRPALPSIPAGSQRLEPVKNAMASTGNNYRSFTPQYKKISEEARQGNIGFEQHPELGMLFRRVAPCENCYELVGKRTETGKAYVKEGMNGTVVMQQTSNEPMHYKDANGNWRTIKTQIEPDTTHRGVYAAYNQACPVSINTTGKYTEIGKGATLQFNNDLELVFEQPGGTEALLGKASWSDYTAGDDGVYVKNAWPGIDIEMYAFRGGIKTNFIINRPMPAYAAGRLLVRDHLHMGAGLTLEVPRRTAAQQQLAMQRRLAYAGQLMIRNSAGQDVYLISDAVAYEKNNAKATFQQLEYIVQGNTLDIALPGNYLDRAAAAYPVVIDPLVSNATTLALPPDGSTYTTTLAARSGCSYVNPATTPANATITDIQFANQYTARNGAFLNDGLMEIYLNTCRSPSVATGFAGLWWYCNNPSAGTCTAAGGATYSMWNMLGSCVPAPQCAPYNLNVTLYLYQLYSSTVPCDNTYIYMTQPFVVTVIGRTVEIGGGGTVSASPNVICNGQSSSLSGTGAFGVPPYSWSWAPGPVAGSPATVFPSVTTNYTGTVTDACGITASANVTVTVNPISPITGPTSVCMGATINLANTAAGTWTSLNTPVATINTNTGALTGVSPGQAVIRFTTNAGCQSTTTITVTPLPGPITGSNIVCKGATTTLANTAPGGTWISDNTAVATINAGSGVVQGLGAGTSGITYTFGGTCFVTTSVLVNPLEPITGTTVICEGAMSQLSNAVAAGAWSSSSTGIASIDGAGMMYGLAGGTAMISYTNPFGCIATVQATINALPVISNILPANPTTCNGADGSITFSAFASGAYAVDYTFNSAAVATTTVTTTGSSILIGGLAQGVYDQFIVTDAATGCASASAGPVTLTDPLPPPMPIIRDNLPICAGQTLRLLATDDVPNGTWSWSGPNGFTSIEQNVIVNNVPQTASGPYTVTYTLKNCPVSATRIVTIAPPLTLTELTLDQTIPYGNTIQLSVKGALYYEWLSVDGSVDNPNINNPIVKPEKTTTYTVVGFNPAGCRDTASVTITVDQNMADGLPSAFTPNGDGLNDVFRVVNLNYQQLVEFTIFNRWGQLVYQNRYDLKQGWDGTFNGEPQDMGVYTYKITVVTAEGLTKYYKGDVTLVR